MAIFALCAATVAGAAGCGGGDGGGYKVRAMFHNAFILVPGEQVKAAGVPIGTIDSLDVENRQAAVVLNITDQRFQDFRSDASCQIKPQSLIGERFVECVVTQPRSAASPLPPPLRKIESGPGKGQYLLTADRTSNSVDLDLINDVMRLPYRQRLSIIFAELGVGLAANGANLRSAVRAANPALEQVQKLTALLAKNNRALATIADQGDRALAPLAAQRARVAHSIEAMATTATATAEKRAEMEAGLAKLPAALRAIRPSMEDLSALADQMQPVATDLRSSAGDLNRIIIGSRGLAEAGTPALRELSQTAQQTSDTLLTARPVLTDLKQFAADARPLAANLAALLTSLKDTGGVERLLDTFFYTAAATNGYDADGHYLRAQVIVNTCTDFKTVMDPGCSGNFQAPVGSASAAGRDSTRQSVAPLNRDGSAAGAARAADRIVMPKALLPGSKAAGTAKPVAAKQSPARTTTDGQAAVLDYLLGN